METIEADRHAATAATAAADRIALHLKQAVVLLNERKSSGKFSRNGRAAKAELSVLVTTTRDDAGRTIIEVQSSETLPLADVSKVETFGADAPMPAPGG